MANYGFIIDNRKCIGCHACTVACKAEHDVPVGVNRTWVKYIEKGTFPQTTRLFSVLRCNHCDDAPCVEICPVTALFRRPDGIVDFDNRRCIGCRACMQACPYDALYIDPHTRTAAKCNYCAHRIDRGLEPACVNVCPTHAIISGDLDDPNSEISRLKNEQRVTVRKPEKGTLPALYYIEGDVASLDPGAAPAAHEGMWNNQTRGVGHYAHFLQTRFGEHSEQTERGNGALAAPRQPQHDHPVRLIDTLEKFLSLGSDQTGVLDRASGNPESTAGRHVAAEVARRTYDAPRKGVLWGWQVPAYMWTKSLSAGAVLLPLVAALTGWAQPSLGLQAIGVIVGIVFLGLTGAFLAGDLDQPKRFIYVLLRPQWRSWLVRGAYLITGYGIALAIWLVWGLGSGVAPPAWYSALLVLFAAGTAMYTALLFAQAKARDFWQSPLLGVHMLLHAILAGGAFYLLFAFLFRDPSFHWQPYLSAVVLGTLLAKLTCDWLELGTTHATADAARTAHAITRGRYRKLYWGGVVVAGTLVPLVFVQASPWLWPPAGLLILAGIYLAEHIWVRAPQDLPLA